MKKLSKKVQEKKRAEVAANPVFVLRCMDNLQENERCKAGSKEEEIEKEEAAGLWREFWKKQV